MGCLETNMMRIQLSPSLLVLWEEGQRYDGRGPGRPLSAPASSALQPGVLPCDQATLHLLSGIMSSPRCCWHKPTFILLFTRLPFQLPIVLC